MKHIKRSLITSSCAALAASGFLWGWLWPVSLAGLTLSLWLLGKSDKLSRKAFLLQCMLYGYIYLGLTLNWIYGINTTDLIADTFFAFLFLGLSFLLMVGFLAIGFVLLGYLYRKLKVSTNDSSILLIPLLWALCEWFRSVFFSVMAMGSGGSVGPFWNFGSLGFLAGETPLGYASRITGLYGTSFLVMLLAVVIYKMYQKQYRYTYLALVPLVFSLTGWGLYRGDSQSTINAGTVSVQADIDDGYQDTLDNQLKRKSNTPVDALVMPEYSYYFVDSGGKDTGRKLPVDIPLVIDSRSKRQNERIENMVSYNQSDGSVLQQYQKNFLIPGGEYIPYFYEAILYYSGNHNIIRSFETDKAVRPSRSQELPYTYRGVTYGALACSGAIAPELYRGLAHKGAEVLTNSASISTLGVSDAYYGQAEQMSKFIAMANAKPFVQSARGGPSYIMNKDGQILARTIHPDQAAIAATSIARSQHNTIYSRFGEWILWLSVIVVMVLLVHKQKINRKKHHAKSNKQKENRK